jgi:hypothetical protein
VLLHDPLVLLFDQFCLGVEIGDAVAKLDVHRLFPDRGLLFNQRQRRIDFRNGCHDRLRFRLFLLDLPDDRGESCQLLAAWARIDARVRATSASDAPDGLGAPGRDDLAGGPGNDVDMPEDGPDQRQHEEQDDGRPIVRPAGEAGVSRISSAAGRNWRAVSFCFHRGAAGFALISFGTTSADDMPPLQLVKGGVAAGLLHQFIMGAILDQPPGG